MNLQLDVDARDRDAANRQQTREYAEQYGMSKDCPLVKALEVVRRKWAIQIVMVLYCNESPIRFNQLERELAPVTQKELTKRLRELEQMGIISRTIYPEVPPRVEYELTKMGLEFIQSLGVIGDWSHKYYGNGSI